MCSLYQFWRHASFLSRCRVMMSANLLGRDKGHLLSDSASKVMWSVGKEFYCNQIASTLQGAQLRPLIVRAVPFRAPFFQQIISSWLYSKSTLKKCQGEYPRLYYLTDCQRFSLTSPKMRVSCNHEQENWQNRRRNGNPSDIYT